jgi:hypothetical protein
MTNENKPEYCTHRVAVTDTEGETQIICENIRKERSPDSPHFRCEEISCEQCREMRMECWTCEDCRKVCTYRTDTAGVICADFLGP